MEYRPASANWNARKSASGASGVVMQDLFVGA
jgi:hypothetical protein